MRVLALLLLAACAETDDGSLEGSQVDETGGSSGSTSSGGSGAAAGTSSTGGSATGGSATGGSGTGGSNTLCTPGATEPCACPGGVTGARRCADTGMGFEGCDCSGQGGSGQGGSGQGGSAQGGSAQGGSAQGGSAQGGSAQGGSGQGGSGTLCTPGQQISCACPGGSQGAQACLMDGSGYGPCMCNGSGGAGQGGSGQGGSSQGGSSQGGSSSGGTGSGSNVTADSSAETCPGQTLDLSSLPVTVTGDTSANSNDYAGHCSYPGASTDVVFHFIAPSTGTLNITLDPTGFDSVVYVRTTDCVSGTRDCATGAVGSGMSEQLTLSVVQGTSYYVHVDGWTGGFNGPYVLTIS